MISTNLYTLLFNFVAFCLILSTLLFMYRVNGRGAYVVALALGCVIFICIVLLFFCYTGSQFGLARLTAWVCFVHIPAYLLGLAFIFRSQSPRIVTIHLVLACGIILVAIDAFVIEPHWLDVTRMTIHSSKISNPVRVVMVADIQTDRTGDYEERALATALAEQPDLLLFAGDYIHAAWNSTTYHQEIRNLNTILRGLDLQTSSGAYAIAGNVDMPAIWSTIFTDLPVVISGETSGFDLGSLYLTTLSAHDSFQTTLTVSQKDKYHIILGHSPNYSLGDIKADLLLAGHTHGGQVRLPFVGPLLTLSAVPRAWASGTSEISPGKMLVVSRGVGMERMDAPRMRFLCRPEIIVINLVPE